MSLKEDALSILSAALKAADAEHAVRTYLPTIQLPDRVHLIAVGKAACAMARAVTVPLASALIVTKYGHAADAPAGMDVIEAGHPLPTLDSMRAADDVEARVCALGATDTLLLCVSGGASALLSAPAAPVTFDDKQQTTSLLLRAGANIRELNAVRKHISRLKGGQLASLAQPAHVVALLLSDVVGDPLDVIGSGLTAPDTTTAQEAVAVLRKYGLSEVVPASVIARLEQRIETPKELPNVRNVVVGSNQLALRAAAAKARQLGYAVEIVSDKLQGEAREVAKVQARKLIEAEPGVCLLSGGETTVTVRGPGLGGRNQEFALQAAVEIAGHDHTAVLCAGTDGTDGPTDAAGAFASGDTLARTQVLGVDASDFLQRNDSYHFFEPLGDLVKTGPTGTNVMDINIMLKGSFGGESVATA